MANHGIVYMVCMILTSIDFHGVTGDLIIEPTDPPNGVEYPSNANGVGIAFFEHLSKNLPLTLGTIKSSTGAAVRLTGDGGLPITMDANGVLTLQQEINHETFCTDASSELSCYKIIDILEGTSTPRLVYIYLKDSNDNLPQFVDPERCIGTIDENTDYPNICLFEAKDEDRWIDRDTLEFSLRDTSALFQIDPASGVLSLQSGQKADFETSTTHRLYIQVKDSSATGPTYTQIITVKDLPDMPPTFDGLTSSYNVLESKQPGDEVTTLKATDGDSGIDDKIKFTFIVTDGQSSSGDDYFALDGDTGKITVNTNLDAVEIMNQRNSLVFSVEVIGTEVMAPNAEVRALISIVVIDEDNSDPHFKDGNDNFEVDFLETQQGIIQSFTVVDDDVDPNLNSYNAELKPPTGGGDMSWFTEFVQVSPTNGASETIFNVQVQAGKSLDFDTVPEWRNPVDFTVDITSIDGTKTITAHIKLTVHGQNDNIPKWEFQDGATEYVVSVVENIVQDMVIATLKATDDDFEEEFGPSSLVYGWDPDSRRPDYLGIDPATGYVTIIKPTAFDFELLPVEVFVVKVWDNNNGPETKSISTFLRINVIDLNDEQPTIRATANRFEIQENGAPGLITQTIITASDADANSDLEFSLSAPQLYSKNGQRLGISNIDWFTIEKDVDGQTANLMLIASPDTEIADRVEFDVVVEDLNTDPSYSGKRTDSISMVITIGDENDVSPVFDAFDPDISVLETDSNSLNQSESQRKIVDLTATDLDSKTNFYFRLTSDHENGIAMLDLVELDRTGPVTNGKVTLRRKNLKEVDRETFAFLDFDITVYDDDPEGGTNPRSDTINLVVAVDDRNDNTPEWIMDYPSFNYHVLEASNRQSLKKQSVHADGDILILPCYPPPAFNEDYCLEATDADDATQSYGQVKYIFDPDTTDSSILAAFDVDLETGCICTKETDREVRPSYDITFMAVDNYRPGGTTDSKNNKTVLHITVDDINDNFPIFETPSGDDGIFATILDDTQSNIEVGDKIIVTDADQEENAQMEFRISKITCTKNKQDERCTEPNPDAFVINIDYEQVNRNILQIVTKEGFTFASALGLYCIEIEATNPNVVPSATPTLAVYCILVISSDVNDEIPYFEPIVCNLRVLETNELTVNQTDVERIIVNVVAKDNDPDTLFCFQLTSDHNDGEEMLSLVELFPVECVNDGKVTLRRVNGKYIDYENFKSLSYNLTVYDDNPEMTDKFHSATVPLEIEVININDNVPVWSENYESKQYFVMEGKTDEEVYTKMENKNAIPTVLFAYDDDDDTSSYGRVMYSLPDDFQGTFHIDPITGRVAADVSKIDRETISQYQLVVVASDNYWPGFTEDSNSIETILHITVQDINDHIPTFLTTPNYTSPGVFVKIPVNTEPHTQIGVDIVVHDADEGFNAVLDISLVSTACTDEPNGTKECSGTGFFQLIDQDVDENTKIVQIKTLKQFESVNARKYCLLIQANDLGTPQQTTHAEYCVLVQD